MLAPLPQHVSVQLCQAEWPNQKHGEGDHGLCVGLVLFGLGHQVHLGCRTDGVQDDKGRVAKPDEPVRNPVGALLEHVVAVADEVRHPPGHDQGHIAPIKVDPGALHAPRHVEPGGQLSSRGEGIRLV